MTEQEARGMEERLGKYKNLSSLIMNLNREIEFLLAKQKALKSGVVLDVEISITTANCRTIVNIPQLSTEEILELLLVESKRILQNARVERDDL